MTQHRRSKTYVHGPLDDSGGYTWSNAEVAFSDLTIQKNKRKRREYEKVASTENFEFRRNG